MGLLRRLLGRGGEDEPEEQDEDEDEATEPVEEPTGDAGARIDAARERLREEIAPLDDEEA